MQGTLRQSVLGGLVLVCVACTSAPPAPTGSTGVNGTSGDTGLTTTTPAPVASKTPTPNDDPSTQASSVPYTVTPVNVIGLSLPTAPIELNAPYSYGSFQSNTTNSMNGTETANFPTSIQLVPTVTTDTGSAPNWGDLIWVSSNPELVMVDQNGWVHTTDPGAVGTATISVMARMNLNLKASVPVVVRNDGKLQLEIR